MDKNSAGPPLEPPPWALRWHPNARREAKRLHRGSENAVLDEVRCMAWFCAKLEELGQWDRREDQRLGDLELTPVALPREQAAWEFTVRVPGASGDPGPWIRAHFWVADDGRTIWIVGVDQPPRGALTSMREGVRRSILRKRVDDIRGHMQDKKNGHR